MEVDDADVCVWREVSKLLEDREDQQRTEAKSLARHVCDKAGTVANITDGDDEVRDCRPDEYPRLELEVVGDPLCW